MSGYWVCTLLRGSNIFREQKFVVNGKPMSSAQVAVEALLKSLLELAGEEESGKDGHDGRNRGDGKIRKAKKEGDGVRKNWFRFSSLRFGGFMFC